MRGIMTFLFMTLSILCFAQGGYLRPNTSFGTREYRKGVDSAFHYPTGNGLPSLRGSTLKQGALFFDSTNNKVYNYNPKTSLWSVLGSDFTAGSNTQIIFNQSGVLKGSDSLFFTGSLIGFKVPTRMGTPGGTLADTNIYHRGYVGNDFYQYGAVSETLDKLSMVFKVGDNGQAYYNNGQRFIFRYDASNSGTQKDPLIIDYDTTTVNGNFVINGKASANRASNSQELPTLGQLSDSIRANIFAAPGSNTQVMYRNSTSITGNDNLTFSNGVNSTLSIGTSSSTNNAIINGGGGSGNMQLTTGSGGLVIPGSTIFGSAISGFSATNVGVNYSNASLPVMYVTNSNTTNGSSSFRVNSASTGGNTQILGVNANNVTKFEVRGDGKSIFYGDVFADNNAIRAKDFVVNNHIINNGTSPTVAIGSGLTGTVTISGSDIAGTVTVTLTSVGTPSPDIATVTFNTAYAGVPHVQLTGEGAAGAFTTFVGTVSTTGFTIRNGISASHGTSSAWVFHYSVIQ